MWKIGKGLHMFYKKCSEKMWLGLQKFIINKKLCCDWGSIMDK